MLRLIGRGGCGEVWEAIQVELDRPVAVKTLREDLLRAQSSEQTREDLVRNFREEALIAARLDHPNIVPVYDYGRGEDGSPELSMKLVRGEPWDRMLKAERATSSVDDYLAKHVAILSAVANAVAFAHSRNIVHRDIKPSQVMVGEFGEVLLMDWGLALVVGDDESMATKAAARPRSFSLPTAATASSPAGTPAYMAPEQTRATAKLVGPWTDIYLLGGCLYCILAGHAPHIAAASQDAFLKAVRSEVPDPRTLQPAGVLPDDLAELAMQALAPAPGDRVASADEFVRRLEDWLSGASRRRESQTLTTQLLAEVDRPRSTYSAHVAFIDRIQRAAGLWPANPDVPELRAKAVEDYAELALAKGDLLLALSQAELLPPSPKRSELERRIEVAKRQRQRLRRALRISVGTVAALVTLVIAGGLVSLRSIEAERDEAVTQRNTATRAQAAAEAARREAETARERANNEQIYAQIRSATSLIEAGRHEMARAVLWSVPEDARSWEWAYLLDRCHQTMAEFPFAADEVSRGGNYFYIVEGDGRVLVRDTMAGALVATLEVGSSSPRILPPAADTHVDVLADNLLLRFAPPTWDAEVLAELAETPKFFMRTYGSGNFAAGYGDGSGAVYDGESGALRFHTESSPHELIGIDGDDESDRLLLAYKSHFRVYRMRDGSLEHSVLGWLDSPTTPGLTNRGHSISVIQDRSAFFYDLDTGLISDTYGGGTKLVSNPASSVVLQIPTVVNADNASALFDIPVGRSESAQAGFLREHLVSFWGGTNGEAGVMNLHDKHVSAELRGAPGTIRRMWGTLAQTHDGAERLFTVTDNGGTQVWLGTAHKAIAELPGQWGSFRRDGRLAVSITSFDSRVSDLESGAAIRRVGVMFRITRGVTIAEELDRIFTFGYGYFTDHVFGWEVRRFSDGRELRSVKAGKEKDALPYLWSISSDNRRVLIFWDKDEPGELRASEDGTVIATIPKPPAPPTAFAFTERGTALIGTNVGTVIELNLEDGSEVRRFETGAPVWLLKAPKKGGLLYVAGGDRRWRAYSFAAGEPTLLREATTGADPAVVLDFSEDGARMLALTRGNEVVVWKQPEGEEVLRFKIDDDVHRIQMNSEGTRIFGVGAGGLHVWDLKGREVAQVPDVLDISLKSRRLLLRSLISNTARDIVIELPPYLAKDLPGDPTGSFQERFELWRREQHRDWWERRSIRAAPESIAIARTAIVGTIAEGGSKLAKDLDRIVSDLAHYSRPCAPALHELIGKLGVLDSMEAEWNWWHFAAPLMNEHWFDGDPVSRELLRASSPYSNLRILKIADGRKGIMRSGEMWTNLQVASVLNVLGYREEAKALALRGTAIESAMGNRQPMRMERLRERLLDGATLPPPPAAIRGDGAISFNTETGRVAIRQLAAETMTPDELAEARKTLKEKLDEELRAWVDRVAPLPDFAALYAKTLAALPPPPPSDMPLTEFMGDVLDRLEREQLDGLTVSEARAAARQRFDDSVAAVATERAAAAR